MKFCCNKDTVKPNLFVTKWEENERSKSYLAIARSHQFGEFFMHNDSSFERNPPFFIYLYCYRAHRNSGDLFKLSNWEKIIAQIKKKRNSSENLKRLKTKEWTVEVPHEFQTGNTTSILAVVAEDKNTKCHLQL